MQEGERVRVLVADDHRLLGELLGAALSERPDFEFLGIARSGREAVQLARDLKPGVVLMDVDMPDLDGIEATRQIASEAEPIRVVALSMHSSWEVVSSMFDAGAVGFVPKDAPLAELELAIRTAARGEVFISPKIAGTALQAMRQGGSRTGFEQLSPRERQVFRLLSRGLSPKEVGWEIGISVNTVYTHRRRVMEKLGIFSIAELVSLAIRKGLLT